MKRRHMPSFNNSDKKSHNQCMPLKVFIVWRVFVADITRTLIGYLALFSCNVRG